MWFKMSLSTSILLSWIRPAFFASVSARMNLSKFPVCFNHPSRTSSGDNPFGGASRELPCGKLRVVFHILAHNYIAPLAYKACKGNIYSWWRYLGAKLPQLWMFKRYMAIGKMTWWQGRAKTRKGVAIWKRWMPNSGRCSMTPWQTGASTCPVKRELIKSTLTDASRKEPTLK